LKVNLSAPPPSSGRRGRPPQDVENLSRRLLDAARDEFRQIGYAAATVDAIVSRAKTSKRTAYELFKNKAALLEAVVHAHLQRQYAPIDSLRFDGMTAEGCLIAIGQAFINAASDADTRWIDHLIMAEASQFPALADQIHTDGSKRAKRMVRQVLGNIDIADREMAVEAFFSLLVIAPLRTPVMEDLDRESYVRRVVRFILYRQESQLPQAHGDLS
jgi:AcrR family transcriptional regulator